MPVCQGCGGSYADQLELCPNCGRARPEKPVLDVRFHMDDRDTDVACPVCHRIDEIQKVSAMSDVKLAQAGLLAPALVKVGRQSFGTTALIISGAGMLALFLFIGILAINDPPPVAIYACLGMMLAGGVPALLVGLNRAQKEKVIREAEHQALTEKYERARTVWKTAYYCSRDDLIYVPGQQSFGADRAVDFYPH